MFKRLTMESVERDPNGIRYEVDRTSSMVNDKQATEMLHAGVCIQSKLLGSDGDMEF